MLEVVPLSLRNLPSLSSDQDHLTLLTNTLAGHNDVDDVAAPEVGQEGAQLVGRAWQGE